jgi:drug/metabolite transporter (DMT)-like permease
MAAVLLALASSVTWGVADFGGGLLTRRLPLAAVTVVSQAAGFVLLVVIVGAAGNLDAHSVAVGAAGGVAGGAGLACFYAALARGTMSIVSPITACSALVPVALSLASGERPSALALGGSAVALAGAVLASFEEREAGDQGRRDAIALAVGAALAIGVFLYFLGKAAHGGSSLSALFGARIGSLGFLIIWALASGARASTFRLGRRAAAAIVLVGVADVAANSLFALASQRGLLAIVSVLGSLFPIVTVVLAHVVLSERITLVQRAGVAVALVGVAVVSAA